MHPFPRPGGAHETVIAECSVNFDLVGRQSGLPFVLLPVLVIVIDNSLPVSSTSTNDEHEHEIIAANMTDRFNVDKVLGYCS
ncbi:hypothetical protein LCGC14_3043000 [marine sediment metagenome]|uniref:Uncharacterized protein n=1 Tax=marine sediment metagenome TaxID=412755 RepID=A0A0F8XCA1_9ZZZZ